ncbi:hypothetical protein K469DRAFT_687197 [Zopfia rhizophila CBS 207.26]|uniref:Zn(2)-C6 fungal-type domain-containing protein n=1 Tax=Zopfia rhizophila CBS 207.26 TaxID=1314779 RepID=A0A6A6E604_9PEZI|nr:hypothetical protein K469DRAFT_687197 [Zopfia rhizophila CBS 207.26]
MAPREGPKCPVACNFCRVKKIKCNGVQPCSNCIDHREHCVFPPMHQRTRRKANEVTKALEDRLDRMESLFRAAVAAKTPRPTASTDLGNSEMTDCPTFQTPLNATSPVAFENANVQSALDAFEPPVSVDQVPTPLSPILVNNGQMLDQVGHNVSMPPPSMQDDALPHDHSTNNESIRGPSLSHERIENTANSSMSNRLQMPTPNASIEEESVVSPQISNSEHHGPVSYLSICSSPAMKWVSERASAPDFMSSATTFSLNTTRRLKMDEKLPPDRAPEPDVETAWTYSNAYFNESLDAVFGIVNRQVFEAKLQSHFSNQGTVDDASWYALRNAVYATGCKAHISRNNHPQSFKHAQSEAWKYFENALSVHTELIYMRSGLMAVQALMIMAFFTEGLGAPALEYMLVSNAVRLAQSKGLHCHPVKTWNMGVSEIQNRSWLFWVIYSYEKHISYRSGRPSAIDDDDISCQLPIFVVEGSTIDYDFVLQVIKHAQITSKVAKGLTSVKSSKEPHSVLAQRVRELEIGLSEWRENMPSALRPGTPFEFSPPSPLTHSYRLIYLHFAYYGTMVAIHSIFAYPWYLSTYGRNQGPAFKEQVAASTKAIVEASRQIVLATKYIDARGSWPAWLTFFYPLLGLINIFVYVLKYPTLPSTTSDLALMDIVAGHFAYLEYYSSSQLSFPFIGEITGIARATVKKAREKDIFGPAVQTNIEATSVPRASGEINELSSADEMGSFGSIDFALENWPSFMPSLSQVSSMAMDSFLVDEIDLPSLG